MTSQLSGLFYSQAIFLIITFIDMPFVHDEFTVMTLQVFHFQKSCYDITVVSRYKYIECFVIHQQMRLKYLLI